ncbi:putative ribonuclease H-like domain-containing protein [Tanacetum coccineum]|uniref:Ribonuclease H-like domain-containing protein n=1 Tax=Tanacetum coccineum TaxID=301880 RepID=A0ABQ5H2T9_9ASTR
MGSTRMLSFVLKLDLDETNKEELFTLKEEDGSRNLKSLTTSKLPLSNRAHPNEHPNDLLSVQRCYRLLFAEYKQEFVGIEATKKTQNRTPEANIVKQEVKGTANSSSSLSYENMAFVSSYSSTNEVNTAYGVSTANTQVSPASTQVSTSSTQGHPQKEDQGYVDSGCSRHMTGNMSYLSDFKEFDGGYVTFGGGAKGGKITGKGTLKTGKLDFEDVYFVKELQFNLFSVSQMCDKKNNVLFTDTGCFVLSPDFKLADESQVLLKVPRKNNMYSVDMKNIIPKESLTCLVAKATLDESMLWHRRLGHVNFKTINKLVKDNLVRGLPSKHFENDQTCVACLKGKQHKASCRSKIQNSITQPLFMLHMDLFGPTFVSSLMNKKYCLVVTDDYSRFTWVFFLASKDETSGILKSFITEIENLVDKKVKIIRCDNGTEFKNRVMSEFCEKKGIKREFSVASTPQQNSVAERINRTLIENRVLVVKPHNKTPDELFRGRTPALSFMRPFGCHVTILNTLDYLGKFDGKSDEGFFVGYSLNSKAFRVYNIRTKKVEESLHIRFLEDKPIIAGTNSNAIVGTEESIGAGHSSKEIGSSQDYILMPLDVEKKDDEGVLTQMLVAKLLVEQDNEMSRELLRKIFMQVFILSTAKPRFCTAQVTTASTNQLVLLERSFVCQPPGFEDPEFYDRVYKVEKALYVRHQAPRAWNEMCTEFEKMMHKKFQMSSIGELTFFLGLQVTQKDDGIFISQDKYVDEILKKFGLSTMKTANDFMGNARCKLLVANSILKQTYVAAAVVVDKVLWIQQLNAGIMVTTSDT